MRESARGFTLVEVLVAAGVGLVVVTAALSVTVAASRAHARRVRLEAMQRASARVLDQLIDELRQAGLGVPRGSSIEGAGAFTSRALVLAEAHAVGFLADVPRPDGTLAGLSALSDAPPFDLPQSGLVITNEQSGPCEVALASGCTTGRSTHLFAPEGTSCRDSATHRTCPWGLARFRGGDWVLVVDAAGHWVERQVASGVSFTSGTRRGLLLSTPLPAPLRARTRGGFLSSVDRLFYRADGAGTISRHQCWGPLTSQALSLGPCPDGDGTAWEPLARHDPASTITFGYFDERGVPLSAPVPTELLPRVARVDVALHLERSQGGDVLSHDSWRSVALRQ